MGSGAGAEPPKPPHFTHCPNPNPLHYPVVGIAVVGIAVVGIAAVGIAVVGIAAASR